MLPGGTRVEPGPGIWRYRRRTDLWCWTGDSLFPKDRPVIAMTFNQADDHIQRVRDLRQPSTIAVVSASARFLEVARGVLASAIGTRHQLQEIFLPRDKPPSPRSADIIFCDSIAKRSLRN